MRLKFWAERYIVAGFGFTVLDFLLGLPARFDPASSSAFFVLIGIYLVGLRKLSHRSDHFLEKLLIVGFSIALIAFIPIFMVIVRDEYPALSPLRVGVWLSFQNLPFTGPVFSSAILFAFKYLGSSRGNDSSEKERKEAA